MVLKVEDIETGQLKEFVHDMVVLSVGVMPEHGIIRSFKGQAPELDPYQFIKQVDPSQVQV